MRISAATMALAWVLAISIAAIVAFVVSYAGERRLEARLADYDVVFLGTSLMKYALPAGGDGISIPQIDAEHALRIGLSRGTEAELLDLTNAAVTAGVRTVFVEINPIVSLFSDRDNPCTVWNILRHRYRNLKLSAAAVIRGKDIIQDGIEPAINDRPRSVDPERLAALYPLLFDVPCHGSEWQRIATASGPTQIVLVALPRDQIAKDAIGYEAIAAFELASQSLAARLGLPLFVPDAKGNWDKEHFLDQAHLSPRGAVRFSEELGLWWKAQE